MTRGTSAVDLVNLSVAQLRRPFSKIHTEFVAQGLGDNILWRQTGNLCLLTEIADSTYERDGVHWDKDYKRKIG